MLTPGIASYFIARNTAARRGTLRPIRDGRQNYAQCVAAPLRFGLPWVPEPPKLTCEEGPYRRFPQTWGWDPAEVEGEGIGFAVGAGEELRNDGGRSLERTV